MDPYLLSVLQQLQASKTRVRITHHGVYEWNKDKYFQEVGYVTIGKDDALVVKHLATNYWGHTVRLDTVTKIEATALTRRKAGNFYKVFYERPEYKCDSEGSLDMGATLRSLLAIA